jgi:hypothetical protein
MKMKILLCLLPLGFAGCAGYNHTLFMTKSNVGLDFDTKPPTLEVTVSRKEAVIAPSFEGGRTPPVLASFKPDAGAGSAFGNFFLGVDQAFAGGDAAVAMAALYATNYTPPRHDRTNYDSALHLSQPPKYTDPFRRLAKPGTTRPFIFGTDTTLGLKAAWTGTGGQFPDTVRLGFNRKEFAWAPVSMTATSNANTTNYQVKMPSFLATIDSRIETGGKEGGISALQYFATGDAATLLALQPVPREAMVYRLDPGAIEKSAQVAEARQRVEARLSQVEIIVNHVTTDGKVDRAKLEPLVKGTGLARNTKWLQRHDGGSPEALRAELSSAYNDYVPQLAKNLPQGTP